MSVSNIELRPLVESEINQLISQGCSSSDWLKIGVSKGFSTEYIHRVKFSGVITLGIFDSSFTLPGGLECHSGIYDAVLHNCNVGDNVLIERVSEYIANYTIASGCRIQNIDRIVVTSLSTFGNGVEVSVLNEVGGREVPIFNQMSAHFAYMVALYRHNTTLIERMTDLVKRYAETVESDYGSIGECAVITGCRCIENVVIGEYALLEGVSRLYNGTINSSKLAPVHVGYNVVAENFIICSGAIISDGATLVRTFVGQACRISKLFVSHDSLFFSNCQCENGEACAVFAGPYTVSMHKSSLLIAGLFSFLNAGSGSNQSNHLYKLGPIHQGIVERGSKTTSDSYVLWPAKIGAFSLIMGRHVHHADTSDLPFSYLIENNNISYLVPGVNLKSVGTIRDAKKWPKRDARKDSILLDKINFNLLSPYTIRKMFNGMKILKSLKEVCGEGVAEYSYNNVRIRSSALNRGIEFYSLAIDKFLGNSLISRLKGRGAKSDQQLRDALIPKNTNGCGEWVDLSGLIVPRSSVDDMIADIEEGELFTVEAIEARFEELYANYYDMEWTWAWSQIQSWYGIKGEEVSIVQVVEIIHRWKLAVVSLDKMLYNDAKKEFSLASKVGFGVDGERCHKDLDFESVRGDFENNQFVQSVEEHIRGKSQLGDDIIKELLRS